AAKSRDRLTAVIPVVHTQSDEHAPADRHMDQRVVVPATGFQQQYGAIGIFGKPGCQRTAGRACAHDDEVEGLVDHCDTPTRWNGASAQPAWHAGSSAMLSWVQSRWGHE